MRLVTADVDIELQAPEFWLFGLEPAFDVYRSARENSIFVLHDLKESLDAAGLPIVEADTEVRPPASLPSHARVLSGSLLIRPARRTTCDP